MPGGKATVGGLSGSSEGSSVIAYCATRSSPSETKYANRPDASGSTACRFAYAISETGALPTPSATVLRMPYPPP